MLVSAETNPEPFQMTPTLLTETDPGRLVDLCQVAYPRADPEDVPYLALLWYVLSAARADLLAAIAAGSVRPSRTMDRLGEVVDFLNGQRLVTFCKCLRLVDAVEIRQLIAADAGLRTHGPRALICLPDELVELL